LTGSTLPDINSRFLHRNSLYSIDVQDDNRSGKLHL